MSYHPVNLIARAIGDAIELPCQPENGICAITGIKGKSLPKKLLLGNTFTNYDLLARPDSDRISVDAYKALKYPAERRSSWFCDGNIFIKLNRIELRKMVFEKQLSKQWVGYATTSYKKHGALRAPVNTGEQRRWLFEMEIVDCTDYEKMMDWWKHLNIFLRAGISRTILETGQCPPYLMRKIGFSLWSEFSAWSQDKRLSPLYRFLCYLLPSQQELKDE